MMKSKLLRSGLLQSLPVFISILSVCNGYGQDLQDSLRRDDDDIVSSIAPYPANVRDAILDVSQYPQKLVVIERLQARTSQSFQDLVAPFPQPLQENFYDLSRYPELVDQLAGDGGTKSAEQLKSILSAYPAEVAISVHALYPTHTADLKTMSDSYRRSQEALQTTIQSLPRQTQEDFKMVISMPDVMNLLTDRIDLTVSLGEAYRNNPEGVRQSLTSLSVQIADQNTKDLDAYKNQVASDPQLQEEMKKSSQDFANNYSDTDAGAPYVINNYYATNPYPYWFGYPYWYTSPMWYPRPLYYHTGFYLGGGGAMVVVGLPSYAYSNWFFNYGYSRYPRMYGRYNGYYNQHRSYRSNMNVYRGYNTATYNHFNHVNNIRNYNQGNQGTPRSSQQGGNVRSSQNTTRGRQSENFRNSINYRGNTFNNQHLNGFQSQQYHQQRWNGVGGSGMQRSSGGNGGNRGGGGNGGGGGRRGR